MKLSWLLLSTSVSLLIGCGGRSPTAMFEIDGDLTTAETFFDLPFPSDLRLTAEGIPDFAGFPNKRDLPLVKDLLKVATQRKGFPVMPIAWFRFDIGDSDLVLPPHDLATVIRPEAGAEGYLIDIDAASSELGSKFPIVAKTLVSDDFIVENVLAVAPAPGIVLRAKTKYAFVLTKKMAPGFSAAEDFTKLRKGSGSGARFQSAKELYAPLWEALNQAVIAADDVIAATVFTTGDEVAQTFARSEGVRQGNDAVISNLRIDARDGASHDGFCEILADVAMPQFQVGQAPFDRDGQFVLDGNGIPQKQSTLTIPLTITLPLAEMPAAGWPLYQFFHGSGGESSGVVDLGYQATEQGQPEVGKGPGWVVARHKIAAASSALPVNPERVPGATDYAYLNLNNLAAFPFTFQQGVFEQRLLLDALLALEIPASVTTACNSRGLALPGGAAGHKFNPDKLVAGGQSMGGMYTNMVGAVEPRFGALVPTGAGGFWNLMILDTATVPGARSLISGLLGVDSDDISFVHPGVALLSLGWEVSEPFAYMARLARRPLPGQKVRHVYQPTSKGDTYFPINIYDAAALAYGNRQSGNSVWPSMQDSLSLAGLGGVGSFPVSANRPGQGGGAATTNVVVQFDGDGIIDPHYIYRQLEPVKQQYSCFFATYIATGTPKVVAPGPLSLNCN